MQHHTVKDEIGKIFYVLIITGRLIVNGDLENFFSAFYSVNRAMNLPESIRHDKLIDPE